MEMEYLYEISLVSWASLIWAILSFISPIFPKTFLRAFCDDTIATDRLLRHTGTDQVRLHFLALRIPDCHFLQAQGE